MLENTPIPGGPGISVLPSSVSFKSRFESSCKVPHIDAITFQTHCGRPCVVILWGIPVRTKELKYAVASVVILCVFGLWQFRKTQETVQETARERIRHQELYARQKAIVDDVRSLVDTCTSTGKQTPSGWRPMLHGKAIVWNMSSDAPSPVYDMLPSTLQADLSDSPVTVFMVIDARRDLLGWYVEKKRSAGGEELTPQITGKRAYHQSRTTIVVAYWPEKKAVGVVSVTGPARLQRYGAQTHFQSPILPRQLRTILDS